VCCCVHVYEVSLRVLCKLDVVETLMSSHQLSIVYCAIPSFSTGLTPWKQTHSTRLFHMQLLWNKNRSVGVAISCKINVTMVRWNHKDRNTILCRDKHESTCTGVKECRKRVSTGVHRHSGVERGLDGKDLASAYVLHPLGWLS
jgi:hypothetical protein